MLIDEMMDRCILMNKTRISDGEGGMITTWTDGNEIDVAIVQNQSMQSQIAQRDGVTSIYTLTTHQNIKLDYHDVIKRKSDGRIYRVTSEASSSPASLDMNQCTAEKWELTE